MALSHFPALVLFAFLVSIAFAALYNGGLRARTLYGVRAFALFIGIALLLGWLMYPIPWKR